MGGLHGTAGQPLPPSTALPHRQAPHHAASASDRADCTAAVRNSCLAPYLINQLSKASFQDMAGR